MISLFMVLFSCLVAISLTWFVVKVGIGPVVSSKEAIKVIVEESISAEGDYIADLGSGFGVLAIALARANPGKQVIGYELSHLPWLFSLLIVKVLGVNNLRILRADINNIDLAQYGFISCFLFQKAMDDIGKRLRADRYNIVSNTFPIRSLEPVREISVGGVFSKRVYVYKRQEESS